MPQALLTLLQHAERQRDQAQAALHEAEALLLQLQRQAEALQSYRSESLQRHPAQGGRSASIELLRCHQGFMQRLDQAIATQAHQVQAAQSRVAAQRAQLLALETRVASVKKLIERRGEEALRREAQREQRRNDDAARRRVEHGLAHAWRSTTQAVPL